MKATLDWSRILNRYLGAATIDTLLTLVRTVYRASVTRSPMAIQYAGSISEEFLKEKAPYLIPSAGCSAVMRTCRGHAEREHFEHLVFRGQIGDNVAHAVAL